MRFKKIGFVLLIVLVICVGIYSFAASGFLKMKILASLREQCPVCKFDVDSASASLLFGQVILKNFYLLTDPKAEAYVEAKVSDAVIHVNLLSLLLKRFNVQTFEISKIALSGVDCTVIEIPGIKNGEFFGPKKEEPASQDTTKKELEKSLVIDQIEISDSKFMYEMVLQKEHRKAPIHISNINATLSKFGTNAQVSPQSVDLKVHALLEKTGDVHITAHIDLFVDDNHDDIMLRVQNQNMSEVIPFFYNIDKVIPKGVLDEAKATFQISKGKLDGKLFASYHGLEVEFQPTEKRKSLENFFTQFIANIRINPSKTAEYPLKVVRKPKDSVFQFMLAAIVPACMKILTSVPAQTGRR